MNVHWSAGTVDCVGKPFKNTPGALNHPDALPKTEKNSPRIDPQEDFSNGIWYREENQVFHIVLNADRPLNG